MNIIRKQKKDKILYFWLPFLTIESLIYLLCNVVCKKYLSCSFELSTALKYYLSKFLNLCEISFFSFEPGPEIMNYIQRYEPDYMYKMPLRFEPELYEYAVKVMQKVMLFPVYDFLLYSSGFAAIITFCFYVYQVHHTSIKDDDKFLSGVKRVTQKQLAALSGCCGAGGVALDLDDGNRLWLSPEALPRHLLILGATGTGKSQLLLQFLPKMLQVNPELKAVIVDVKGEFIDYFYNPQKDFIFNPYDSRSIGYNFFNELSLILNHNIKTETEPPEVRMIADALADVSSHANDSNKWVFEGASNIFYSAIMYCYINNLKTMKDFISFLREDEKTIEAAFAKLPKAFGSPGKNELAGDSEAKQNVVTEMRKATTKFSALLEHDGDFSIKQFMEMQGNLYLSRAGANAKNFDSVFKLMLDLFARYVRTGTDSKKMKYLMLVDEFGELPALGELSDLIRLSRSKGCCILLANQTIAKIREKYNEKNTADILGNINSRFYFKIKEQSEAEYVAKNIGSARVERTSTSDNTSAGTGFMSGRAGDSESQTITNEPAFTAEEIMSLPVGHCIPDIAGLDKGKNCHAVGLVQFKLQNQLKHKNEPFQDYYAELEAEQEQEQQEAEKKKKVSLDKKPLVAPDPDKPELEEQKKSATNSDKENESSEVVEQETIAEKNEEKGLVKYLS